MVPCQLQAITYLQSAARLKGAEEIEKQDILEIAAVSIYIIFTVFSGILKWRTHQNHAFSFIERFSSLSIVGSECVKVCPL